MGSAFNSQILVEKLTKLNASQQSIETLSHWCIFHMNKAKQVVETWDRQFHYSPREQRLAFLYLANDILQNSRRKGVEFVGEFWRVLPDALRDVIESGDEFGRNAALRMITIWEERKVFGSRGQILKEEFVQRHLDVSNRNEKPTGLKPKQSAGNHLDKIVSSYQLVYGGQLDEDSLLNKCRTTISSIDKVDKELGGDLRSGHLNGSGVVDELKGQYATLRECVEQLTSLESSRMNLVTHLREVLQEQEYKLNRVRNQLQAAHARSEQAGNLCSQLISGNNSIKIPSKQSPKEGHIAHPHDFVSGSKECPAPVIYTRQVPFAEKSGSINDDPKSAAAAMAAKLTSSTSSAQMLTYVLSSLASEGVISNPIKDSSGDIPADKRPKLEDEHSAYVPSSNPPLQIPSFSHPESVQPSIPATPQDMTSNEQPPPPSSPPPMAPLPPMQPYPVPQYIPAPGPIPNGPYGCSFPPVGLPVNGFPPFAAPGANAYPPYPTDGGFYSQPSSLPMAPINRP